MTVTATERSLICTIASQTRWGREPDRTAATQPGRDAWRAKLAREVDPDGTLPDDERERRVDSLMKAEMTRRALRSVQARRRAKEAREAEAAAEAAAREFGIDPENPTADLDPAPAPRRRGRKARTTP